MIKIVTGWARSGTSLMMQMLEAGGVRCIYRQRYSRHNPRGFYESREAMRGDFTAVPEGAAVKCLVTELRKAPPDTAATVIIMRRALDRSLESLNLMLADRGFPLMGSEWAERQAQALDDVVSWCYGKPYLEVWYDDVLADPMLQALRVNAMIGGLNVDAMAAQVFTNDSSLGTIST